MTDLPAAAITTLEGLEAKIRQALEKHDRLQHDRQFSGASNDDAFVIAVLIAVKQYAAAALEAAAPHITAAERQRILALIETEAPRYALGATALRRIAADLLTEGDTT